MHACMSPSMMSHACCLHIGLKMHIDAPHHWACPCALLTSLCTTAAPGSEQSPGSPSEATAHAATASQLTGATTRSGAAAKEQLASARSALRRRDRRIAALSRQVAALQQQLAASGDRGAGGGKLALYQASGALAPVSGNHVLSLLQVCIELEQARMCMIRIICDSLDFMVRMCSCDVPLVCCHSGLISMLLHAAETDKCGVRHPHQQGG